MPQWRVRDVMTTDVITAPDDASIAEIVAVLTDRKITAVPIVDRFDVVLGVVSWTDRHPGTAPPTTTCSPRPQGGTAMTRQPGDLPPATMPSRPQGERPSQIVDLHDRGPDVSRLPPDSDDNRGGFTGDIVDEWGRQSFPASDPPGNW